jgi:sugar phosphate isomerase/epimerase
VLEHIHLSEPNLGNFAQPQVDHERIAQTLRSLGWNKWISIEMRTAEHPIEAVKQALDYVKAVYNV